MGEAIGELLPLAVGVAISPLPIIAVILMLFSDRARATSLAFLLLWVGGIAVSLAALVAVASAGDLASGGSDGGSTTVGWIKVVLGILVLVLAVKEWRGRPGPDAAPELPGWMQRLDTMRPVAALGLMLGVSLLNPKNLLLLAGGAVAISQAGLAGGDEAVAIAVFTVIAALGVAIPTLAYLIAGRRAQPALDRAKAWLESNNSTVMTVLLLAIGVALLGRGLGPLS